MFLCTHMCAHGNLLAHLPEAGGLGQRAHWCLQNGIWITGACIGPQPSFLSLIAPGGCQPQHWPGWAVLPPGWARVGSPEVEPLSLNPSGLCGIPFGLTLGLLKVGRKSQKQKEHRGKLTLFSKWDSGGGERRWWGESLTQNVPFAL